MCQLDCKFLEDRNHVLEYGGTVQSAYTDQTLKLLVDLFARGSSDDRSEGETPAAVPFAIQLLIPLTY